MKAQALKPQIAQMSADVSLNIFYLRISASSVVRGRGA